MTKIPKKILVVDDSPVTQGLCRRMFENAGYAVIGALSGKECMEKVKIQKPDVILMDVILTDSNGKELVRELRKKPHLTGVPIIFMTNTLSLKADKGYETFAIDGELFRAFAKPVHIPKILSAIRKEFNRTLHGGQPSPKLQDRPDET